MKEIVEVDGRTYVATEDSWCHECDLRFDCSHNGHGHIAYLNTFRCDAFWSYKEQELEEPRAAIDRKLAPMARRA